MTLANDLSPAISDGVIKVKVGFSIPPNGQDGGNTKRLYSPHKYGLV